MAIFNKTSRDSEYVCSLKQHIEKVYNIKILSINEAERGWYGETLKYIN